MLKTQILTVSKREKMLAVNHLTLLDVPAFKASVSLPVMKGEMYIKKKSHQTLSFGNQASASSSSPVLHKGGKVSYGQPVPKKIPFAAAYNVLMKLAQNSGLCKCCFYFFYCLLKFLKAL